MAHESDDEGRIDLAPITGSFVRKGGHNRTFQLLTRPPPPPPMRPLAADEERISAAGQVVAKTKP